MRIEDMRGAHPLNGSGAASVLAQGPARQGDTLWLKQPKTPTDSLSMGFGWARENSKSSP